MNPDTPRASKHARVSLIMVKNVSTALINQQESPQKIPEKPVDDEKKDKELDPASLGPDGALQYYSKVGDVEAMRKAYREGGKVNVPERGAVVLEGQEANHPITGDYPLHMAAGGGHQEAMNELFNWEADIEAKNRIGSTALLRAASHDQIDIVKRLLKEGASIETTNKIGNTALHCAAYTGSFEVAKLLIEAQASAHILQANKFGATPLMLAAKSSAVLAKYLLSFRPGRSGLSASFPEETKETKEKRLSVHTTEKRSSMNNPNLLPSAIGSVSDITSPSIEQRTIAAPSLGGNIELTQTVNSTSDLDPSEDREEQ